MKFHNSFSIEEIKKLPPKEAIDLLNKFIEENPKYDEALVVRGQKYWSMGLRKEAINDYLSAIKLNPESRAKLLLEFSNSILDFYNKDLLNP